MNLVTIMLVTSFGLMPGPPVEKGEDCIELGHRLVKQDYITHDFGCFTWPMESEVTLPDRKPK